MTRSELEHLIRAAGRIAGDREIVVIGSQAVLGQFPEAPAALCRSMEGDIYPKTRPEMADKADGAIGEGSRFHEQFGYYAQGVGERTAILPRNCTSVSATWPTRSGWRSWAATRIAGTARS